MLDKIIEEKKLQATKGMYTIATISFIFLSIINYFDNTIYFIQSISSFIVSSICLGILFYTKNYKTPVYISIVISFFIHFIGFLTDSFVGNQADLLWIINITILAFYTVGTRWALVYLITNSVTLMTIKILASNGIVSPIIEGLPVSIYSITAYIINIVICIVLFLYMIYQILRSYDLVRNKIEQKNTQLKLQHEEKTVMLKEIHHRVKNNLQVITSLLRLQLFQLDDENAKIPFQDSINRIAAMALIHSKMYQGDTVNQLNLKTYLNDLSNEIVDTYQTNRLIKTSIYSEVSELELNDLVPFSLIINELITNSIKHGFKEIKKGEININITNKNNNIQLEYKDNGEWQTPKKEQSFGLELIETLVSHFNGSYQINHSTGTTFLFTLYLN